MLLVKYNTQYYTRQRSTVLYSALSDDQIDPPDSPQCTSTPVKSLRHKSEKNVSKLANKLTTIIVNKY